MEVIFVKKAYKAIQLPDNDAPSVEPDKFTLKAFNYLPYDREISDPLIASRLLGLPNNYILFNNFKSINLDLL